jgi:hypothetical protein
MRVGRTALPLFILCLLGGVIFFTGLNWGLPSRRVDPFLFGNHPIWSGKQILALLPLNADPDRPADVAETPLTDRSQPISLNGTDTDRARIIRRYRLFSHQPDEITTFMGLSRMNPRQFDFDPRMYQYGGLWFYPVGALLKISSCLHLIDLRSDPALYLDHPEQFAKFYLVDRTYTACWAILGIVITFMLAGRLGGDHLEQCFAALGFIFLPVVIYTAHEAKPHLPGAVLALLTILMGVRFIRTSRHRYALAMIVCCGLACSMVLTNLPLLLLIPFVFILKNRDAAARGIGGIFGAVVVYLILNPYVGINLLFHRARLFSSFSNSAAMYHFSILAALGNAVQLIVSGIMLPVFILGIIGLILFTLQKQRRVLVLIAAGLLMAAPYFVFAANKPAEYGRFALLPDLVLMLLTIRLLGELPRALRLGTMLAVPIIMAIPGLAYWHGYLLDAQPENTRMELASDLSNWSEGKDISVALTAEPAPYSAPPMNLFDWKWVLLPHGEKVGADLPYDFSISTIDSAPTPMSWASKQFAVYRGKGQ